MEHSKKKYYRAVFISDVHLGYKDCKATYLLDFLDNISCDTLYLLGDIIDLWSMKRRFFWHPSHYEVLARIKALSNSGTRVIYVPGNHDETFRKYANETMMGIEVHQEFTHETIAKKRFLLMHGDDFDSATRYSKLISVIGDAAYDFLLFINRWSNRIRKLYGGNYWSLASYIKGKVNKAKDAINAYESAAIHEAKKRGYDGIVCGHIHHPHIKVEQGVVYCNDGDWIENCTALVENANGKMELLHWSDCKVILAHLDTSCMQTDSKAA